jgi:hypothetical protein
MKLNFQEFHLSRRCALDSRQSSTITVTSSRASSKNCALFVSGPKIQATALMILSGSYLLEGPLLVNLLAIHRLVIHLSICLRLATAGPAVAIQGWLYLSACKKQLVNLSAFKRQLVHFCPWRKQLVHLSAGKNTAGPLVCFSRQRDCWSICLQTLLATAVYIRKRTAGPLVYTVGSSASSCLQT